MVKKKYKHIALFWVLIFSQWNFAQKENLPLIHSHNDYYQETPFWKAYSCGLNSIEIDVFLKNDSLFVTHSESEIIKNLDIESLYLKPLQNVLELDYRSDLQLQLLVDIKSEAYSSLDQLTQILECYPKIIYNQNIDIVISGNRPQLEKYLDYPKHINFDYQSLKPIENPKIWDKISLISLSFKKVSNWNGKGRLINLDYQKIKSIIHKAHSYNKPFRFWATPDIKTAWKVFYDMGVDFINTDLPCKASDYLSSFDQQVYKMEKKVSIYHPTYKHDQKKYQ
jgi:alkaline phosphatase